MNYETELSIREGFVRNGRGRNGQKGYKTAKAKLN